jgi:hypothetical protein
VKGRDAGLVKLLYSQATKAKGKALKKSPVEKFQDSKTAETSRLQEKARMAHEQKMARLANKKLKYEMANQEANAQRTAQLELLRLQIKLETVKAQASMSAVRRSPPIMNTNLPNQMGSLSRGWEFPTAVDGHRMGQASREVPSWRSPDSPSAEPSDRTGNFSYENSRTFSDFLGTENGTGMASSF